MKYVLNSSLITLITLLASLFCVLSFAQEENGLNIQIELGAIFTSGNTEDENIQFGGNVNWIRDEWNYGFSIDGFRAATEGELTAQRIYYVTSANYAISDTSFILTQLTYDDDRFSGYDSQSDISVNYGRNLFTNKTNMAMTLNIGLGMRQSRSEAEDFDEAIVRMAVDYDWTMLETVTFHQELSSVAGNETSIFRSETSIETQILDNLSLKFSINIKHQTEVPDGREKTDTETSLTFVMNF